MSPKAQQVAILKALGWSSELVPKTEDNTYGEFQHTWWKSPKGEYATPTDYGSDLNAIREAEGVLSNLPGYCRDLCAVVYGVPYAADANKLWQGWWAIRATAAQRCEAFLRTLNLWDDTK